MGKRFASWKKLFSEEVFSSPWMSIYHDQFRMQDGVKGNYFYLHTRGSALIIPVTGDGKILLIRQYRYLIDSVTIELPCGGLKEEQNAEEAARSELLEETGYRCGKLRKAGVFVPYNGLSDETCTVFVAGKLTYEGQKPDETEQIEVMTATPDEVDGLLKKGKITDGMTIAGWALGRRHI